MSSEHTIQSEYVYRGKIVAVRVDTVELPLGGQAERVIVEHSQCTATVAVIDEDVLLVRQYRKAVEEDLLEIPAGKVDPEEMILFSAQRELEEETGYLAGTWKKLGSLYTSPGFCNEVIHMYLAQGLEKISQPDEEEISEVLRVPITEIPNMIATGRIHDAKSVAGLLIALQHVLKGAPHC